MKTKINYPYPLLNVSNEDYIDCSFNIELASDPEADPEAVTLYIKYNLNAPGLQEYINSGAASAVVYVECVDTQFRNSYRFESHSFEVKIPIQANLVASSLLAKGYIIANNEISPFKLPEHNGELFADVPFNIRKGDILAISEDFIRVNLDSYDPLADRPSIFSVRKQLENNNEEISVNWFEFPKITIFLNEETFNKYSQLYEAPELRQILDSILVGPVLVDVLTYLKNASTDDLIELEGRKWYQIVKSRLDIMGISLQEEDSMTKVVAEILPHFFSYNIDAIKDVFSNLLPGTGEN